ncbi:heme NO-binding domain-containing protein [Spongorhabdus nitratireducens]
MKGVVFTEFLEMVESQFSYEVVDAILEKVKPESGGSYTTLGTYDHHEIVNMVVALSEETGTVAGDLIHAFGMHLFARFSQIHNSFFDGLESTFDFLERVEDYIHVEVAKLYPDAELPTLATERPEPGTLTVHYYSRRPFADLALGLIDGCIKHFDEKITVSRKDLSEPAGTDAVFTLKKGA